MKTLEGEHLQEKSFHYKYPFSLSFLSVLSVEVKEKYICTLEKLWNDYLNASLSFLPIPLQQDIKFYLEHPTHTLEEVDQQLSNKREYRMHGEPVQLSRILRILHDSFVHKTMKWFGEHFENLSTSSDQMREYYHGILTHPWHDAKMTEDDNSVKLEEPAVESKITNLRIPKFVIPKPQWQSVVENVIPKIISPQSLPSEDKSNLAHSDIKIESQTEDTSIQCLPSIQTLPAFSELTTNCSVSPKSNIQNSGIANTTKPIIPFSPLPSQLTQSDRSAFTSLKSESPHLRPSGGNLLPPVSTLDCHSLFNKQVMNQPTSMSSPTTSLPSLSNSTGMGVQEQTAFDVLLSVIDDDPSSEMQDDDDDSDDSSDFSIDDGNDEADCNGNITTPKKRKRVDGPSVHAIPDIKSFVFKKPKYHEDRFNNNSSNNNNISNIGNNNNNNNNNNSSYNNNNRIQNNNVIGNINNTSSLSTSVQGYSSENQHTDFENQSKRRKVQFQADEKRLSRFRSAPSKALMERIHFTLENSFILISQSTPNPVKVFNDIEIERNYQVLDHTHKTYHVYMTHLPACNCPASSKGLNCIHILFIFIRVLRVSLDEPILYQRALLTSELCYIFSDFAARNIMNSDNHNSISHLSNTQIVYPPVIHNICKYCFEDCVKLPNFSSMELNFDSSTLDPPNKEYCLECPTCKLMCHPICNRIYRNTTSTSSEIPLTSCPHCRETLKSVQKSSIN